ncbi:DNA breaking-rejoining enzyme [Suillus weaverae]|nr:DNA breaking-rejoining enzyme [Suillus weaverae]
MTVTLALLRKALAMPPKPRKPKNGNKLHPSLYHLHVLAHEHIRRWLAPHSNNFHNLILEELPMADVLQLLDMMLISIEPKTRENYGAGLLHFDQFCDSHNIAEDRRMPASDRLLASFIASCARKVATTTAQSWLAGLHFWHNLHSAQWNGNALLQISMARLAKLVPDSSKRPCHPPVTLDHMHALFRGLDLLNVFDAAVFGVACVAFWCCCRLGKLVIDSISSFDSSRHVSHGAPLHHRTLPNQTPFIIIRILWTKMTHGEGADIIASKVDNLTNPISALEHHLSTNRDVPASAPFFAFECAGGGWAAMMRPWFLAHCNQIWKEAELPELTGHCFRIGGASELLLRGIPLDIIESILPLFVTSSSMDAHIALVHSSMDSFAKRYK